jgi:hypothetical protein
MYVWLLNDERRSRRNDIPSSLALSTMSVMSRIDLACSHIAVWLAWAALFVLLGAFHYHPQGTLGNIALVLQSTTAVLFTIDLRDANEEHRRLEQTPPAQGTVDTVSVARRRAG